MPEKVPLWVVENTFNTFGSRMPGRPATITGELRICATCKKDLIGYQDWNYYDESYYCNVCVIPVRRASNEKWRLEREEREREWAARGISQGWRRDDWRGGRNYSSPEVVNIASAPRTEAEVPKGNLEESMYQYWIGDIKEPNVLAGVYTAKATCRACGEVVHGSIGRQVHKQQSTKYYKAGDNCMKVISLAIRDLVHLHNCFICKTITTKKHYGVPICSPACHKVWRFDDKRTYPELEIAMLPYWAGDGRKIVVTETESE
jgi:hypothetical protein